MDLRAVRRIAVVLALNLLVGLAGIGSLALVGGTAAQAASGSFTAPMGVDASTGAGADAFGDAVDFGSMHGVPLAQPVVGMAATRTGRGYWLIARDGGVFSFGDATFFGSTGAMHLNQPIVGVAPTPTGKGYWFVAADGGIFSFGDAHFAGSTGAIRLNQPIVAMASTPSGKGYWLVARDGGIFSFGDATYFGSTGGQHLNQPIAGMAATPTGKGYWLTSGDGNVYPFGDAKGLGSAAGRSGPAVVAIAPSASGTGYWLPTTDGAVFAFGTAPSFGSARPASLVVGIAATPSGKGYWLTTADGSVLASVAAAPGSGSYAFLRTTKDGSPVRYNPCADQHFVINPAGAPAGGVDEVKTAFANLAAATGIHFVDDGTTAEAHVPFGQRKIYQPALYGDRWAPILVLWANEQQEPLLDGGTLGYGGSTSYWAGSSTEAYVTGEVVLDTSDSVLRPGFGPGLTRGNLVSHEIGHVAGLDHTTDSSQVMYPSINQGTPNGYGSGDRAGLTLLGARQGCVNVAKPQASLG